METGKMITHLHNQHDYRFVECSLKHEHTPACFELPESHFYYITDAKLIHQGDESNLPTTNLLEFRRVTVQETQANKIAASRASTTDLASTEVSDSMSIAAPSNSSMHFSHFPATPTSMPASVASTSSMLSTIPTSVPETANASDIRACMAAFASTHSNAVDVAKHTELLIDLDIPVSEWGSIETVNLEAMEICWTPRDLVRWKIFARKWAASHVL
jgi:hypothetical protein